MMTSAPRAVRPATAADAEAITGILADGFQADPPLLWILPDPAERRQLSPVFFRPFVDLALADGRVFVTDDLVGASLWLHVDVSAPPPEDDGVLRERLIDGLGAENAKRFFILDELFAAGHPGHESHAYLLFVGVTTHQQNQGIGTAMLADRLAALDEAGQSAYLEASCPRNAALYARLGFAPLGEPVHLPDGPTLHPMWRPAAGVSAQLPRQRLASDEQPAPTGLR